MICPHCNYIHGSEWDEVDTSKLVKHVGDKGAFYELQLRVNRTHETCYYGEDKTLFACPSCMKTFID